MLVIGDTAKMLLLVFVISFLGYLLGRVRVCGVNLGTAGVFMVGLVFGHFGVKLPALLQTLGLVLLMTAMGFGAGTGWIARMKQNGLAYAVLCLVTAATGGVLCRAVVGLGWADAPLALGMMTGAFTTSPGFAAAKEALSAADAVRVAAGYGVTYPVGVLWKVLFIQCVPRLLRADMEKERRLIAVTPPRTAVSAGKSPLWRADRLGFCSFALAAALGIALGSLPFPLPGGGRLALGSTGGSLMAGLVLGGAKRFGCVDIRVEASVIQPMKELGVMLFFVGAGVEGGHGVAAVLTQYGALPLLLGTLFVLCPMTVGLLVFRRALKLPLLNGLGAMTASMTSTPSLAALTQLAGTDDVVAAYATTYPMALMVLVLMVQILAA